MFNNTDKDWESYGRNDPYFGVLTNDKFRSSRLTDENRQEFFRSGEEYVNAILKNIRQKVDGNFSMGSAVDFGCGVGRLVIPLAAHADSVVGVDVSESMLKEASKNCEESGLKNVSFVQSDDTLSRLQGEFDFVHSYIVFQHIPVDRGEQIFRSLLNHLTPGGVGVVHFTYAKDYQVPGWVPFVKKYVPFAMQFNNWIKGEGFVSHGMQMNPYDMNHILLAMQKTGVRNFYAEFTHFENELGLVMYFKKQAAG